MTYKIRATDEGYELQYGTGATVTLREAGGHGPLEKLYAVTERMIGLGRQGRTGVQIGKADATALMLACDELKQTLVTDLRLAGVLDDSAPE